MVGKHRWWMENVQCDNNFLSFQLHGKESEEEQEGEPRCEKETVRKSPSEILSRPLQTLRPLSA